MSLEHALSIAQNIYETNLILISCFLDYIFNRHAQP